ncbi:MULTISPECIES: extracellular solute-binding protein [Microbacterium]|uniref:sugar ABC transporter substrate-binding protein n=1 Tax=Microbacterium TaxID=33882 RepID=UPI002780DD46|nr:MULTISPECIES: extracellular solute-binding protein [Microbacterium]MDQ1082073.1 multiple sugar transport system substrate-binding protein [Microbacterium sp. SORGH_AS_0344]MDQ1169161.1 multiple sugar transport system substrate-binding protein [Microbacterium proteolyticum]
MSTFTTRHRTLGTAALAAVAVGVLAGCSGGVTGSTTEASGTFTFWDPYPQYDETSEWAKVIGSCAADAGVTVERTGFDTSDLTSRALLSGQQGDSPDILLIDNPAVSTLVEAGLLTSAGENNLEVGDVAENILGASVVDGETYGVPIGANTLALYYNPQVLSAAGVDISSVEDWVTLNAAIEKVVASGKKGITFSAIGTEEGSFQFLPWYWGSGAELTELDSADAVSAVQLWTDWVSKGWAPNSVINNTQTTSWEEFLTGEFAFAENGTWQKAAAAEAGYEVIPIPAKDGGAAAAPTGGEFLTLPVQSDPSRYEKSAQIVSCLTSTDNVVDTDNSLNYIAATPEAQQAQLAEDATLEPWIEAVNAAQARTGDNLGTRYPVISEQLWTAVQNALTGVQSPQDALTAAQQSVSAG